jgi:cysteine-rich repeat protein
MYSTINASITITNCLACPANAVSPDGSDSVFDCRCNLGYRGPDGENCTACLPGSYKDVIGPSNCTLCPANTYNPDENATDASYCRQCSEHMISPRGSGVVVACICDRGYTGEDGTNCTACVMGKYKDTQGDAACTDCGIGKYLDYTAASNETECKSCVNHHEFSNTAATGSADVTDCRCVPGYFGYNGIRCRACPEGTYKEVLGPGPCDTCPLAQTSPEASNASSACECSPGYARDGANCTACPEDTYREAGQPPTACSSCPENTTSPPASGLLYDCVCKRGYIGWDGAACQPCPAGTYKPVLGSDVCRPCVNYSLSPEGSSFPEECVCLPGFEGTGDTSCQDVDECTQSVHDCSSNAICGNTFGSFQCTCKQFFWGDGTACQPATFVFVFTGHVDMRVLWFQGNASIYTSCVAQAANLQVSFVELFDYYLQRDFDVEVDVGGLVTVNKINATKAVWRIHTIPENETDVEASLLNSSVLDACITSKGLPILLSTSLQKYECGDAVVDETEECDDGNALDDDGCSSICRYEQPKGYTCVNGNVSLGQNSTTVCTDVDECDIFSDVVLHNCDNMSSCINTVGSFRCVCVAGFVGDGTAGNCKDDYENYHGLQPNAVFAPKPDAVLMGTGRTLGFAVAVLGQLILASDRDAAKAYLFQRESFGYLEGVSGRFPSRPTFTLLPSSDARGVFGISVGLARRHAVVGSSDNRVYVYNRFNNRSWPTLPSVVLTRSERFFGSTVATTDDEIVVGAYGAGRAFIFRRNARGVWNSTPAATLRPGSVFDVLFGHGVAMTENQTVVASLPTGKAYVYMKHSNGSWPELPNGRLDVLVGTSVVVGSAISISENHIFIGVPDIDTVYIFTKRASGDWPDKPTQVLTIEDGQFGSSVANTDLFAIVGALGSNAAYVYKNLTNGTWVLMQRITEVGYASSSLGYSVAMQNHDIVLGSHQVSPCFFRRAALTHTHTHTYTHAHIHLFGMPVLQEFSHLSS